jgi:hypothetical protein
LIKASEALANYKGRDESSKKKAIQKANEAVAHEKETCKSLIAQVFKLYFNLLTEEAKSPWSKILGEQIEVTSGPIYLKSNSLGSKKGHGNPLWME